MKIGFVGQRGKPKRETGPWLLCVTGQRDNQCITDPDGVKKMGIQATGVGGEGLKQCLTTPNPRLSEILPHRLLTWGGRATPCQDLTDHRCISHKEMTTRSGRSQEDEWGTPKQKTLMPVPTLPRESHRETQSPGHSCIWGCAVLRENSRLPRSLALSNAA